MGLAPPCACNDWVGLTADPLPLDDALRWAGLPSCGAAVLFTGNVRDVSPGRPGVHRLSYEAYDEEVEPRLAAIAAAARQRWPDVARLVLLHRVGDLAVGESAVVVVASSPHRDTAFEAARYCIDTLKATVPIWKREAWDGGDDWSASDAPIAEVGAGRERAPGERTNVERLGRPQAGSSEGFRWRSIREDGAPVSEPQASEPMWSDWAGRRPGQAKGFVGAASERMVRQ